MDDKAFPPEEVGIDGKLLIPVEDNGAGSPTARRQTRLQERESAEEKGKEMTATLTRKALAVLMAIVLALGFVATPSGQALAVGETGTLIVKGDGLASGDSSNRNNVYALQMFSAEVNGASISYTLNDQFKTFFRNKVDSCFGKDGVALSEAAYAYVAALGKNDGTQVTGFAKMAADYVVENRGSFSTGLKTATVAAGKNGEKDTATFSDLEFGYYLVLPFGSSSTTRGTYAILDSVLSSDSATEINLKSEYPTVDKTIIENPTENTGNLGIAVDGTWDNVHQMEIESLDAVPQNVSIDETSGGKGSSAAVGDTVTFEITSAVPDMSQYDEYTFIVTDTLSKGLSLLNSVGDPNIVVTVDGKKLVEGDNKYSFHPSAILHEDGTTTLTVDLSDFLTRNKDSFTAGDKIVIRYQAKVNEDAVIATDPNTNSAKVEYSNDPNKETTGTSTSTETHTYTFGFTINKENEQQQALANAQFKIYKDDGDIAFDGTKDDALTFAQKATSDNIVHYMLDDNQEGEATVITTDDTNDFMVCGLGEGTYWVEEVAAPTDYNKLSGPIKVTISAEFNTDGTLKSHTINVYNPDGTPITGGGAPSHENDHLITIVNKSGAELPSTGGMGTVIFTVVGVAVVIGGVAWILLRRRSNDTRTK